MKATVVLVTLAAVLFGFVVLVEKPIRDARLRESTRKVFPSFNPGDVRGVLVRTVNGDDIHIVITNNSWRIVKPINYPADVSRVAALVKSMIELEWKTKLSADDLKDRPNVQEEFGMSAPQLSIGIETTHDKFYIDVGSSSAVGDEVFLQMRGGDNIYLASADFLKAIPKEKDEWRDKALVRLADMLFDGVRITNQSKVVELTANTKTHLWQMNTPLQARADTPKIIEMLKAVATVQISAFVADDPKDLEPFGLQTSMGEFDLSFIYRTNAVLTLRIGLSPTNQTNLVYVQRSDTTNVMLVPRGPLLAWQTAYTNFLDPHMVSMPAQFIDGIQVHGVDDFKLERKADQSWQVVSASETFPADEQLVQGMLDTFTGAEIDREKMVVAEVAAYGLKPPLAQFTLKSTTMGNPPDYAIAHLEFGTNNTGRIFERSTEEESVNSVAPEHFARLPRISWQLRDRRVWTFDPKKVVGITIHQQGFVRKLMRDPFGTWTFAPGYNGMIKQDSLEESVVRMSELKAAYWSSRGDANLERFGFNETDHQVTFEVKNGDRTEAYSIAFGKPSEQYLNPYATIVRNGQRLVFEFPVDVYYEFVRNDLTIPPAYRIRRE